MSTKPAKKSKATRKVGKTATKKSTGISKSRKEDILCALGWGRRAVNSDIWYSCARNGSRVEEVEIDTKKVFKTDKELFDRLDELQKQANEKVMMVQPLYKPKDIEKMKKLTVLKGGAFR